MFFGSIGGGGDANVLAKKDTAVAWCLQASEHEVKRNGKKWRYILIPHTSILPSATLRGLIRQYSII